jgi:hypothetical protein
VCRFSIPVQKDGYVLGSQLEQVLGSVVEALAEEIGRVHNELNSLRAELDAERRLRLSMKR